MLCANCCAHIPVKVQTKAFPLPPISKVYVLTDYTDSLVSKALKKLKFRFVRRILEDMKPFFASALSALEIPENAVFVPVPLHFFRRAERGFNQSELIAHTFSLLLRASPKVASLLKRSRATAQQARLHKSERILNVQNAFMVRPKVAQHILLFTPIVLIDDVATTGSTLLECVKALQAFGYTNINAIVIAHG